MFGKRRGKARSAVPKELPADALRVLLTWSSSSSSLPAEALEGCPVMLIRAATCPAQQQPQQQQQQQEEKGEEHSQPLEAGLRQQQLLMASWSQLPELISWFCRSVSPVDSCTKLSFDASLPKDCRADVHNLIAKKHKQCCESISEAFGDDRYVAVIAKGAGGRTRRVPQEQADHALALWLLYKEHLKQQKQQQQQQQEVSTQQEQHQQQQQQQQISSISQQKELEGSRASTVSCEQSLGALQLSEMEGSGSSNSDTSAAAAAAQHREYSRDEVAQMLMQDKLPDDLAALWHGPAGDGQRWSREMCLAASAGEVDEVQALIDAKPYLLAQNIRDLSSGGQLPLHLAAAAGAVDVLQLLLAAGADVAAQNGYGETALQVAQRCEQCDCEAVLLQAGAVSTQVDSWQDFADKL